MPLFFMFRINVYLSPLRNYGSIPFSYNQMLAAGLYKRLSPIGQFEDRFATSNLSFESNEVIQGRLHPKGNAKFTASFMTKHSYQEVYECLIEKELAIGDNVSMLQYLISDVQRQPPPVISNVMRYGTASPIVVRKKQDNGNDLYLMPGERDFEDMFFEHAYYKFIGFTGSRVDVSKCTYKPEGKLNTKLISIRKDNTTLQVRGFVQPFTITAPEEIQQTLIYAGAGDMNSLGFGCVEV